MKQQYCSVQVTMSFVPILVAAFMISGGLSLPVNGKFEKFAEQYKPVRETVCAGKATKAQLTSMVQCMEQFKASFKDMTAKVSAQVTHFCGLSQLTSFLTQTAEVKSVVQDCLAEGDKDITFEVDKSHLELVYLMCSKKFGHCLHRQLPKFQPPGSNAAPGGGGKNTGPPPEADKRVEQFIVSLISKISVIIQNR